MPVTGPDLIRLANELRGKPGVQQAVAFGNMPATERLTGTMATHTTTQAAAAAGDFGTTDLFGGSIRILGLAGDQAELEVLLDGDLFMGLVGAGRAARRVRGIAAAAGAVAGSGVEAGAEVSIVLMPSR